MEQWFKCNAYILTWCSLHLDQVFLYGYIKIQKQQNNYEANGEGFEMGCLSPHLLGETHGLKTVSGKGTNSNTKVHGTEKTRMQAGLDTQSAVRITHSCFY